MFVVHDVQLVPFKDGSQSFVSITTTGTLHGRPFITGASYHRSELHQPNFVQQLALDIHSALTTSRETP